ncbi:MAG: hypothetical protein RMY16_14845 [Nostoc sp. DedQUE12b]|uniref:hypothetical protein n=1 Tax=Nostoc sp. DedQUE12b TaxID=3075398 RepID=UPI002AD3F892|nr:hypothetical protein [Nostoc sp. DedQUE12b]MDZ8086815.1 hypothetical protein [Nostoc sp. DedQUE12b]
MANPSIYTVGGTVQAGGGIYIPHLQFVRDMLTKRSPDSEVLTIYRQIRWGKRAIGEVVESQRATVTNSQRS